MAALNLAKHIKRLVARRDRLTRETASKQRQLDVVVRQLVKIHAALPADPTEAPVPLAIVRVPEYPESWKLFVEKGAGA